MPLGEIARYARNHVSASAIASGSYIGVNELLPGYRGAVPVCKNKEGEKCIEFLAGDILLGNIRPYLKKMWLADRSGGTNGDVLVIRVDSQLVSARYINQVLRGSVFVNYNVSKSKGSKMPRGDKAAIMQFLIPVPSLEEQERIVSILDKFDMLVNDISHGLPTEIEARRKQYEYYREKLLTFKEKAA